MSDYYKIFAHERKTINDVDILFVGLQSCNHAKILRIDHVQDWEADLFLEHVFPDTVVQIKHSTEQFGTFQFQQAGEFFPVFKMIQIKNCPNVKYV